MKYVHFVSATGVTWVALTSPIAYPCPYRYTGYEISPNKFIHTDSITGEILPRLEQLLLPVPNGMNTQCLITDRLK